MVHSLREGKRFVVNSQGKGSTQILRTVRKGPLLWLRGVGYV